jgi:hypothetical protein
MTSDRCERTLICGYIVFALSALVQKIVNVFSNDCYEITKNEKIPIKITDKQNIILKQKTKAFVGCVSAA